MTLDEVAGAAEAVTRFVIAADGIVPEDRLVPARALARRTAERLGLTREHTVVALAGPTGAGKSSLFNALARMELSTVGVRRPTTANAFACVWGTADAEGLLDWVGVAPQRRFRRESLLDAEDHAALRGLVLLDLPDLDSVATDHRAEVDRLLAMVDLVVWVTDPQKYADAVLHDRYLRGFRHNADVCVVVLNQADRLAPADADRCLADLRALLVADGLPEVPVLEASATGGRPGIGQLRAVIERAVATRRAAPSRLVGDVAEVAAGLADLIGPPAGPELIDVDQVALLADALAGAAGVPALGAAVDEQYRQQAARAFGRRWRRQRVDPVSAVRAAQPAAGQRAAIGAAVRAFAQPLAARLPAPWSGALTEAARSRLAEVPEALDRALARTEPGWRPPLWWQVLSALQGLAVLAALGGAGWLASTLIQGGNRAGPTALLVTGLAVALLVGGVSVPLINAGARAARQAAERRLLVAVRALTREYVVGPARAVLLRYAQARDALG
jgi:GTP-binding protein EngB required for normal cell division